MKLFHPSKKEAKDFLKISLHRVESCLKEVFVSASVHRCKEMNKTMTYFEILLK